MTQLLLRPKARPGRREDTLRVLAGVALGPAVAGVALVAVVVLVLFLLGGVEFDGAAAVTSAAWLAAHQVPLRIDGQPLGVLPLLPTLGLVAATARSVRAGVRQSGWTGDRVLWLAGAAVAGPLVVALLAVGLLAGRPSLLPVEGVSPLPALLAVLLVHGVGAAIGAAGPSGRWRHLRDLLPAWAWRAVELGPRVLLGLLGGGALLLTASLLVGFSAAGSLYGPGASVGTVLGLTVVSLLYLPNAVVAATAVSVGPGVEIGRGSVTAVGVVGGPVPPLPLLGGLPGSSTSWLWLLVLLLPVLAGVVVGRAAARRSSDAAEAVRTVLTVAGLVGVALAAASWLAGGRLGGGVFDPVHVPAGLVGVVAAVWLGVVGAATSTTLLRHVSRRDGADDVPPAAADDEADDVPADDEPPAAADDAADDAAEPEDAAEHVADAEDADGSAGDLEADDPGSAHSTVEPAGSESDSHTDADADTGKSDADAGKSDADAGKSDADAGKSDADAGKSDADADVDDGPVAPGVAPAERAPDGASERSARAD